MKRLRQALLIALTLFVTATITTPGFAETVVMDPAPGYTRSGSTSGGSSDSGEPDIGQAGKGNQGESFTREVPERLVKAVQWIKVVWSTRYLGIGF